MGSEIVLNVTPARSGSAHFLLSLSASVSLWLAPFPAETVQACQRQATGWGRRTHNQPYVFTLQHSGSTGPSLLYTNDTPVSFVNLCSEIAYFILHTCIIYNDLYLFSWGVFFSAWSFGFYICLIISCSRNTQGN